MCGLKTFTAAEATGHNPVRMNGIELTHGYPQLLLLRICDMSRKMLSKNFTVTMETSNQTVFRPYKSII